MHSHPIVLVHSPELEQYHYPPECPFKAERAGELARLLDRMGLLAGSGRRQAAPTAATRSALEAFHAPRYLDALHAATRGHLDADALFMGLGTADCPIFTGLYDYASLAAGATLLAADLILAGDARVAFNPSGGYHHAFPARAGGFCYINDVVLGCLRLADAGKRVLFLDVDVHHCDGVQHAFYSRADVLTLSLHESGATLFPGTGSVDEIGTGDGTGYSVNVPLPVDTYDAAYLRAFDAVAMPVIRAFAPDVIVLELGMDALAGDPLAHLKLTNNATADVVARVMGFGIPILATGGGGYHAENTARGWALAWRVFCGEEEDDDHAVLGLGGVMLESAEWRGGLRDRVLAPDARECEAVDAAIDETVNAVKATVFPLHGLATLSDTPRV